MGRICLQLLPKPDQEIVYGAGRRQVLGIVSPDLFEQILAGDDVSRTRSKMPKDLELAGGKLHSRPVHLAQEPAEIQSDSTPLRLFRLFRNAHIFLAAPQQGADACHQLRHSKRLGHVVVRPKREPGHLRCLVAARRQHEDECLGIAVANLTAQIKAGDPRQHQVEDHDIGAEGADQLQGGRALASFLHVKALHLQGQSQTATDGGIIFYDQDTFSHSSDSRPE